MEPIKNMPLEQENILLQQNSEEVQEIITAVPSWILRRGITLIFAMLLLIVGLSAFISYPDVVRTNLRISSLNSPKPVLAKQNGKLTALLVKEGDMVVEDQPLAYFESTANPDDILHLGKKLKNLQSELSAVSNRNISGLPVNLNLGELQGSFQNFYQEYLQFLSTQKNGYYLKKMQFLRKDLSDILAIKQQILKQQKIQQQEYANTEDEYVAYKKLYATKVISRSEFGQQENKYLASKHPLQQTETAIMNNNSSYSTKEKELLDLQHSISEQQAKFVQALNQCINEADLWIQQHILRAPVAGRLTFAGIVQQNQNVMTNQEVFIINPGNTNFFGEIHIPQYNMGKIMVGKRTLVKLKSYPFEQYGLIRGKLTYISEVPYRDSVFIAKVSFDKFENKDVNRKIILKNGMLADAEIITEESSLLQRFLRNITKMMNNN